MRDLRSASIAAAALVAVLVPACSVLNAPDDVIPGGEGGQGSTTASTAQGDPATTTGETVASSSSGGGAPPVDCETPTDCAPGECQVATCEGGTCVFANAEAGVTCGPQAAECVGAGRCDGAGSCEAIDTEGASCSSCDGEPFECVCRAGACATCDTPAGANFFADAELVGWELEGGWGLYTRFPRDRQAPTEVPIGKRVLGTDGNRAHPYPGGTNPVLGGERETSRAISPPTVLPPVLSFLSWHEDEGGAGGRDNKRVVLDVQGVIRVLIDCATGEGSAAFCAPPPGGLVQQRAPDAWDLIEVDLPQNLVGQVGRIELHYDTLDENGGRERGWFIDAINATGRCGCASDDDCGYLDTPCSEGVCDAATSACTLTPRAGSTGDACGDAEEGVCSAPDSCDPFGLCNPRDATDSTPCAECADDDCQACGAGECIACTATEQTFDGSAPTNGWDLGGGSWAARANAPASTNPSVAFASQVFGTTGQAASTAATIETAIPETLRFRSWHVDQGGAGGTDVKTIRIEIEGREPIVILDCENGPADDQRLCLPITGPRAANDFDEISLPTGPAAGQVGRILFGYDDGGAPQTFEQGWYIDDLNAVRCP